MLAWLAAAKDVPVACRNNYETPSDLNKCLVDESVMKCVW